MVATMNAVPRSHSIDSEAAALGEVEHLFCSQLSPHRLQPGAALAVSCRGRLVLDLYGGFADTQRGDAVCADTLFSLFSCTKPFASVALWQQIECGRAALDDPVAAHWPTFGCRGKERVTLRHILSHRGGFPTTPSELTPERWGEWQFATSTVAAMPLDYPPGTTSAYHQLTQQWVCAEVVRRLDGRAYADYVRAEITGPLGMPDTHLGLPSECANRLAKLHATDGTDAWCVDIMRTIQRAALQNHVVPAACGVATARDMARFYAALAAGGALDGARILQPETVARLLHLEVDGEIDATFDVPVRRGLGFELGGLDDPRRHWPGATSTERTFWHGEFGSSVCWGDADKGLAMAFLTNGVRRDQAGAIARRDLSDAVRAAFC